MTDLTTAARLSSPSRHGAQARMSESDADIFLKRSAAYYHAQPPARSQSAHATLRQRDPMLADTLQSLAPSDTRFSPSSMHTRLQSAQQTLAKALTHLQNGSPDKNLLACAQTLRQQITEALVLQQEASDNQRLLIKA